MLINSAHSFEELGLGDFARAFHPSRLCTVAATEIALKHVGRPLPNAALLGGFAALSGQVKLVVGDRRDPREVPAPDRRSQRRRRARGLRAGGQRRETAHA